MWTVKLFIGWTLAMVGRCAQHARGGQEERSAQEPQNALAQDEHQMLVHPPLVFNAVQDFNLMNVLPPIAQVIPQVQPTHPIRPLQAPQDLQQTIPPLAQVPGNAHQFPVTHPGDHPIPQNQDDDDESHVDEDEAIREPPSWDIDSMSVEKDEHFMDISCKVDANFPNSAKYFKSDDFGIVRVREDMFIEENVKPSVGGLRLKRSLPSSKFLYDLLREAFRWCQGGVKGKKGYEGVKEPALTIVNAAIMTSFLTKLCGKKFEGKILPPKLIYPTLNIMRGDRLGKSSVRKSRQALAFTFASSLLKFPTRRAPSLMYLLITEALADALHLAMKQYPDQMRRKSKPIKNLIIDFKSVLSQADYEAWMASVSNRTCRYHILMPAIQVAHQVLTGKCFDGNASPPRRPIKSLYSALVCGKLLLKNYDRYLRGKKLTIDMFDFVPLMGKESDMTKVQKELFELWDMSDDTRYELCEDFLAKKLMEMVIAIKEGNDEENYIKNVSLTPKDPSKKVVFSSTTTVTTSTPKDATKEPSHDDKRKKAAKKAKGDTTSKVTRKRRRKVSESESSEEEGEALERPRKKAKLSKETPSSESKTINIKKEPVQSSPPRLRQVKKEALNEKEAYSVPDYRKPPPLQKETLIEKSAEQLKVPEHINSLRESLISACQKVFREHAIIQLPEMPAANLIMYVAMVINALKSGANSCPQLFANHAKEQASMKIAELTLKGALRVQEKKNLEELVVVAVEFLNSNVNQN